MEIYIGEHIGLKVTLEYAGLTLSPYKDLHGRTLWLELEPDGLLPVLMENSWA